MHFIVCKHIHSVNIAVHNQQCFFVFCVNIKHLPFIWIAFAVFTESGQIEHC